MKTVNVSRETPALSDLTTAYQIYHEESAHYAPREDKKMYEELRGKGESRIYIWGQEDGQLFLHISTEHPLWYNRLAKLSGIRRYTGSILRFPAAMLTTVAEAVHARKKRHTPELSEEDRKMRGARLTAARKSMARSKEGKSKTDDLLKDDL